MDKFHYQHDLRVACTIAEDISVADLRITRYYTDGSTESAGVTLTPADFDSTGDLRDALREIIRGLAEAV